MKLLIALSLLLNTLLFAQVDKLERLIQLQREGVLSYTYLGNDIYKLTYPNGESKELYLGKAKTQITLDSIPTTVIDTWNVDTMLYHNMYSFWKELPTTTLSWYRLIIGDANNNGLPEIYAPTSGYDNPHLPDFDNMQVFEIDTNVTYTSKHTYADSIAVLWGLYDIKRDGNLELLTRRRSYEVDYIFFKKDNTNGFPTTLDFVYTEYPYQKNSPTFGDFDKNGKTDLLFYSDDQYRRTVVAEYDSIINNFETVYIFADTNGSDVGYVTGDFDMDGKTDIVFGSVRGEVSLIENNGEHNYSRVFTSDLGYPNAYMMTGTNDIDDNGKPEFWISCSASYGTNDVLRYTCFETTGDNIYKAKYRLDFLNMFPLFTANIFAVDVDKDKKDEIIICIDEHVFIIKCVAEIADPAFKVLYMSRNSSPGSYEGASMFDLNGDGYEELLIHRLKYRNDGKFKRSTDVFKPDFLTSVNSENNNTNLDYSLEQNYPNPFNPSTRIQYQVSSISQITLKVYDILGNEIITLVNEEKQPGKYTVQWNGRDKFNNTVSSGIYFINLKTPDYNKTIKGVMLK
jgi:hypothetical protein